MKGYVHRTITPDIIENLEDFPSVALLGPRQCGKSTLAKHIIQSRKDAIYLDLESIEDRAKISDPTLFFSINNDKLICIDEIQNAPELFSHLRSIIDENQRNGQFLFLGSASRDLIKQSSQTLAGRIIYQYLNPFSIEEVFNQSFIDLQEIFNYLLRGGFPNSFLAKDLKVSLQWRKNFIETFLQRDLPQMGFSIPPEAAARIWTMCAHNQGQVLNTSKLGESMGLNHQTIRRYLDVLLWTFMLRELRPIHTNIKKRLIKSSKIYIRDTGILFALLNLQSWNDIIGHPVYGAAWETLVIESIIMKYQEYAHGFYRTSHGAELDLVLSKFNRRIAIECKASKAPKPNRGFYSAMDDLEISEGYIIAPIDSKAYPIKKNIWVMSLGQFLQKEL